MTGASLPPSRSARHLITWALEHIEQHWTDLYMTHVDPGGNIPDEDADVAAEIAECKAWCHEARIALAARKLP